MNLKGAILGAVGVALLTPPLRAQDIHRAAMSGDTAAVRAMIKADAALLNQRNTWGRTPLCATARDGGDGPTVRMLIALGADVNAADNSGWTPIMLAAWRPNKDAVQALLDASAELPIGGHEGAQILKDAADGGLERLFETLLARGTVVDTAAALLHAAAGGGSRRIAESLVGRGFDANGRDRYGWAPLHIAAEQGHREIMALLMERGADIDARNMLGQTAYNIARDREDPELMAFLASVGADTSAPKFPKIKGKYLGRPRPGLEPEEFAPGIVSHRYRPHSTVAVSPKGDEIFWNPMIESRGGGYSFGYIMATRIENGYWTYPRKAAFSEKDFRDDHPFFSHDGKRLYFLSERPVKGVAVPQYEKRTWYLEKTKGGWSEPKFCEELPIPAGPRVTFLTFSFDRDGNYYYATDGDLWLSRRVKGKYAAPEKFGSAVNTDKVEMSPMISPEGDYLLFLSGSPPGPCVSFRNKDGSWTQARSLADRMKSRPFNFAPAGDFIMIGGDRWVDAKMIERLKPKE
jgi:ankyrin repeat protein